MQVKEYKYIMWCPYKQRYRINFEYKGKRYKKRSFRDPEEAYKAATLLRDSVVKEFKSKVDSDVLEGEEWVHADWLDGDYFISNLGRVKTYGYSNYLKKPYLQKDGYLIIHLKLKSGGGRAIFLHRLVAKAFLGFEIYQENSDMVIDHIDENKLNNCLDNLQIVSRRYNSLKSAVYTSSQYPGVNLDPVSKKWVSCTTKNGKFFKLGIFDTELEAAEAFFNKMREWYPHIPEKFCNLRYNPF